MSAIRYASVALLAADDLLPAPDGLLHPGTPGSRAPHLWLQRGPERLSTLDLFGDRFVLLAGPGGSAWQAAAVDAASALEVAVDRYLIGPDGDLDDPGDAWRAA